jgi:uncharacterized protein (TIGR02145 family)
MSRSVVIGLLAGVVAAVMGCVDIGSSAPPVPPMPTGSVTDVEGNVYPTIVIGKQEWMVLNLKTTTYNDGTPIPNVADGPTWANLVTDAYAWYDNDAVANEALYGALYNWYAVDTGKLCPAGWAMPSQDNWGALADALGGDVGAGGPMKEPGTVHWQAPNAGATNLSGFSALPAGMRNVAGSFDQMGQVTLWWTSDEKLISLPRTAYFQDASYMNTATISAESPLTAGYSVRCFRAAP